MTPERDIERVLEAWLEPGASKMPDRIFDAVVDRIERVPQRRFVWPHTRFTAMTPMLKFAAVAVLALLIGIGVSPLASNLITQVSASPSPSPAGSTIPEGTYTALVDTSDTAGLDFEGQCVGKPGVWQVRLLIRSGNRWNAQETCPGLDLKGLWAQGGGSYTVSEDRLTMIDGSEPANMATFAWRATDDGLTLELLDVTHPDQLFAFRFLLSHDWVRMPEGLAETYVVDHTFPMRVTLNVPQGWSTSGELYKPSPSEFALMKSIDGSNVWWVMVHIVTNVMGGPCGGAEASPPVGPSVEDLTNALTNMSGVQAGPVTGVEIDGRQGTTFELDLSSAALACPDSFRDQWSTGSETHGIAQGQHQRVSIVDVDGTRILLAAQTFPWTSVGDEREADRVLQSVRFGGPVSSVTP